MLSSRKSCASVADGAGPGSIQAGDDGEDAPKLPASPVPASDIDSVASFALTKHLEKDDYLFREGEPARGFYVVQQGRIKVHRVNANGKGR